MSTPPRDSRPRRNDGSGNIAILLEMLLLVAIGGLVFTSTSGVMKEAIGPGAISENRTPNRALPHVLSTPGLTAASTRASGGAVSLRSVAHRATPSTLQLVDREGTSRPIPDQEALELKDLAALMKDLGSDSTSPLALQLAKSRALYQSRSLISEAAQTPGEIIAELFTSWTKSPNAPKTLREVDPAMALAFERSFREMARGRGNVEKGVRLLLTAPGAWKAAEYATAEISAPQRIARERSRLEEALAAYELTADAYERYWKPLPSFRVPADSPELLRAANNAVTITYALINGDVLLRQLDELLSGTDLDELTRRGLATSRERLRKSLDRIGKIPLTGKIPLPGTKR